MKEGIQRFDNQFNLFLESMGRAIKRKWMPVWKYLVVRIIILTLITTISFLYFISAFWYIIQLKYLTSGLALQMIGIGGVSFVVLISSLYSWYSLMHHIYRPKEK